MQITLLTQRGESILSASTRAGARGKPVRQLLGCHLYKVLRHHWKYKEMKKIMSGTLLRVSWMFCFNKLLAVGLLFSRSVCLTLCTSIRQQARSPCPSLSPGACSNSGPLSRPCHPTISSSVAPSPALHLSQHQQWGGGTQKNRPE